MGSGRSIDSWWNDSIAAQQTTIEKVTAERDDARKERDAAIERAERAEAESRLRYSAAYARDEAIVQRDAARISNGQLVERLRLVKGERGAADERTKTVCLAYQEALREVLEAVGYGYVAGHSMFADDALPAIHAIVAELAKMREAYGILKVLWLKRGPPAHRSPYPREREQIHEWLAADNALAGEKAK